jgi:hypothetical protein
MEGEDRRTGESVTEATGVRMVLFGCWLPNGWGMELAVEGSGCKWYPIGGH